MSTYLVIGATGKTGRRIVTHLENAGHQVRAASRHSESHFLDWAQPSSYGPAVAGAGGVFLTVAGQDPQNAGRVSAFLSVAVAAGVERAVLLSARAVEFFPEGALAAVEQAVAGADLAHTILRPSWFAQNFTESFLAPDPDGVITAPTGDGAEPFIDLDDLAEVAADILMRGGADGTIELSGSQSLSFGDAVRLLAQHSDRPLRFSAADPARYREALAGQLPSEYVAWRMAMFDAIRNGNDSYLSTGVQDVLGRPARSFSEWVSSSAVVGD